MDQQNQARRVAWQKALYYMPLQKGAFVALGGEKQGTHTLKG